MNDEVLTAVVSRIKYAKNVAKEFEASGMVESAELWHNMAGFTEGILYDLNMYDVIKELRENN